MNIFDINLGSKRPKRKLINLNLADDDGNSQQIGNDYDDNENCCGGNDYGEDGWR